MFLGKQRERGSIPVGPRDWEFLKGQGRGCGRSFLKGGLGKGPGVGFWLELLVPCLLQIGKKGRQFFFFVSFKTLCGVSLNTKEPITCLRILKMQKSKHEEIKPPMIMLLPEITLVIFLCLSFQYLFQRAYVYFMYMRWLINKIWFYSICSFTICFI